MGLIDPYFKMRSEEQVIGYLDDMYRSSLEFSLMVFCRYLVFKSSPVSETIRTNVINWVLGFKPLGS
jgi:hypothetical protein